MLLRCGPGVVLRYALQPAHQEAALRQKRGDLDDIAERGVRLVDVAVEIFERGALGLRSPFSAYNSSRARGFRERDKRDLERGLLGGYEVPGSECALESRARVALRSHEHTFSYMALCIQARPARRRPGGVEASDEVSGPRCLPFHSLGSVA